MVYHKRLSIIIAAIGLACAASVFAGPTQVPQLTPFTGGIPAYTPAYLDSSGDLQVWSAQVTSQVNANAAAIFNNLTSINTLTNTTIPGINSTIATLPTTAEMNTDIGTAISAAAPNYGTATQQSKNTTAITTTIPSDISSAIATAAANYGTAAQQTLNTTAINTTIPADIANAISGMTTDISSATTNNVNTAIGTAIGTVNNPANNAVNTATTTAITDAEASTGSITNAITTATTPMNNIVSGTTSTTGTQLTYGLQQHMGAGFWFANSNATLRTALNNAGAEAAKNGNSQTVKLSGGVYTLSNLLPIPVNVTLEGAGEAATRIITNYNGTAHYPIQMSQDSALANLTIQDNATAAMSTIDVMYNITNIALPDTFVLSHVDVETQGQSIVTTINNASSNDSIFTLEVESSFFNSGNANFYGGGDNASGSKIIFKNNMYAAGGGESGTPGCSMLLPASPTSGWTVVEALGNLGEPSDVNVANNWAYCTDTTTNE